MDSPALDLLTEREMQCAQLWVQGLTSKEVAHRLFISEHTVRTHVAKVYFKLNVSTKLELRAVLDGDSLHEEKAPCVRRGIDDVARFLATLNVAHRVGNWDEAVAVITRDWADQRFDKVRKNFTGDAQRLMVWLGLQTSDADSPASLPVRI